MTTQNDEKNTDLGTLRQPGHEAHVAEWEASEAGKKFIAEAKKTEGAEAPKESPKAETPKADFTEKEAPKASAKPKS